MRVVRVRECGPPEVLRIEAAPRPAPGAGEVLVDARLAGVSYGDVIVRSGRYPFPLPYVPGVEVAGDVVEIGPDVDPALLGRRVVASTPRNSGGYAEFALAEAAGVFTVPASLPLPAAITVFQAGALAIGMLRVLGVTAADTVLVTAAAGRVGSQLVRHAKALGARVVAAAGGEAKLAAAEESGADVTVDYTRPGWTDGITASVVLDAVGGAIGRQAVDTATDRIGLYGFTSGEWADTDAARRRGVTVTTGLRALFARPVAEQRADAEAALCAGLAPRVHATYPLDRAAQAHTELEQRGTVGALLLAP